MTTNAIHCCFGCEDRGSCVKGIISQQKTCCIHQTTGTGTAKQATEERNQDVKKREPRNGRFASSGDCYKGCRRDGQEEERFARQRAITTKDDVEKDRKRSKDKVNTTMTKRGAAVTIKVDATEAVKCTLPLCDL